MYLDVGMVLDFQIDTARRTLSLASINTKSSAHSTGSLLEQHSVLVLNYEKWEDITHLERLLQKR